MNDLVVCIFASSVAAALVYVLCRRGERTRFQGELAPLENEIDKLAESFATWRRTLVRRQKNAPGSSESDDQDSVDTSLPPPDEESRQARLARIRRRFQ